MARAPRGRPRRGQARGPGPSDRAGAQAGALSDGGCVGGLVGSHPGLRRAIPLPRPHEPAGRQLGDSLTGCSELQQPCPSLAALQASSRAAVPPPEAHPAGDSQCSTPLPSTWAWTAGTELESRGPHLPQRPHCLSALRASQGPFCCSPLQTPQHRNEGEHSGRKEGPPAEAGCELSC